MNSTSVRSTTIKRPRTDLLRAAERRAAIVSICQIVARHTEIDAEVIRRPQYNDTMRTNEARRIARYFAYHLYERGLASCHALGSEFKKRDTISDDWYRVYAEMWTDARLRDLVEGMRPEFDTFLRQLETVRSNAR